jgi:hypothetical protein
MTAGRPKVFTDEESRVRVNISNRRLYYKRRGIDVDEADKRAIDRVAELERIALEKKTRTLFYANQRRLKMLVADALTNFKKMSFDELEIVGEKLNSPEYTLLGVK